MSREIEVKVIGIDIDLLEDRLKNIGAELISIEEQKNIILDTKDKLKNSSENSYLRIRETNNKLLNTIDREITFKENISNKKARENIEIESKISDIDSMLKILSILGYDILTIGYKYRKSYMYNNIRFDLDTWDQDTYPESYMEIEVESEEELDRAITLLKIKKENITTDSIVELKKKLENQS